MSGLGTLHNIGGARGHLESPLARRKLSAIGVPVPDEVPIHVGSPHRTEHSWKTRCAARADAFIPRPRKQFAQLICEGLTRVAPNPHGPSNPIIQSLKALAESPAIKTEVELKTAFTITTKSSISAVALDSVIGTVAFNASYPKNEL